MRYPNVYGIDMPTRAELIASGRSDEEIRIAIGADALIYQDIESMKQSVRDLGPHLRRFEASCFDGVYITGDITPAYLDRIETARGGSEPAGEEPGQRAQMNLQFSVANDSR